MPEPTMFEPTKILMIEDHPGDARLTQAKLAQTSISGVPMFEVEWVDNLTEGLARLGNGAFVEGKGIDVVLTDLDLPDSERDETLSRLRTQVPQMPIVVLGGWEDEALALQCVRDGAQDYLFKGHVTGVWLAQALRYAIVRQHAQMALLGTRKSEILDISEENTRALVEDDLGVDVVYEGPEISNFPGIASQAVEPFSSSQYIGGMRQCCAEVSQNFVREIAHDLRTPLRIVKRCAERLDEVCRGQSDAEVQRCLHFVIRGVARMDQMLEGLVAYARVESGAETLVLTDIESVLGRVLQTLHFEIMERGAVVTHDPLPSLLVDAVQLEQVFQNLIDNALKYQPSSSESRTHKPRIHITAQAQGNVWRFAVQDNGIGIAPEDHPRVFKIFDRLHTQEEYPGSGMGLAICKRIVERHGGQMGVESEPGNGATFYFTLPRLHQLE